MHQQNERIAASCLTMAKFASLRRNYQMEISCVMLSLKDICQTTMKHLAGQVC